MNTDFWGSDVPMRTPELRKGSPNICGPLIAAGSETGKRALGMVVQGLHQFLSDPALHQHFSLVGFCGLCDLCPLPINT